MQTATPINVTARGRELATRHWATAGIALAGASLIAITPTVTPVSTELNHDVKAAAVRLSAGWEPLTAWTNAFNTTSANASTLANNFFLAPFVGLQQAIVNQVGYADQLLNDPASLQTVLTQIANNINKVATGLPLINADAATVTAVTAHTLDGLHGAMRGMIPSFLPPGSNVEAITAVVNFLSSPVSGVLMGMVGPIVSPAVALFNSALAITAALQDQDPTTALQELVDMPANIVNAFLNGAKLNLDALTPFLNDSGVLGTTTLSALDIGFGGLFSVGSVSQGTYEPGGTGDPITTPGGSILNSIGMTVTTEIAPGVPITLPIASQPIGPIGAMLSVSQTIGQLLGSNWDGKNGNPVPPLSQLKFPTLPTPAPAEDAPAIQATATTTAADATIAATETVAETVADTTLTADSATAAGTESSLVTTSSKLAVTSSDPEAADDTVTADDSTETASTDESTSANDDDSSSDTDSTTNSDQSNPRSGAAASNDESTSANDDDSSTDTDSTTNSDRSNPRSGAAASNDESSSANDDDSSSDNGQE